MLCIDCNICFHIFFETQIMNWKRTSWKHQNIERLLNPKIWMIIKLYDVRADMSQRYIILFRTRVTNGQVSIDILRRTS